MASEVIKARLRASKTGALALSLALAALGGMAPTSFAFQASNATKRSTSAQVGPIYHKDRSFGIPFNISEQGRGRLKEVQLWVSDDSGFNWTAASKTTPDQKKFTFRARADGEYWFAVRTLSVDDRYSPPIDQTIEPSMKVVIDSTSPSLILEPAGRRGSVVQVRWAVKDENLDLKSLALEYQVVGGREWRSVPLGGALSLVGKRSWDTNTIEAIRVRGSVADKAGNIAEYEIVLPEGAGEVPSIPSGDPESAFAPPVEQISRGSRSPITESPAFPPVEEDDPVTAPPPGAKRQVARQARAGADAVVGSHPPTPDWDRASNGGGAAMPAASNIAATAPAPAFPDPFPNPGGEPGAPPGPAAPAPATAPAAGGNDTKLVNSPRFKLQYAIDDAGPAGPPTVELWMTRDGGRTWIRRGEDTNKVAPFAYDVDLGGEGTFGIELVVRSASGLGDPPPAPGDLPKTWVEVDSTPPKVQLQPPLVGTGVHAGKVAIRWQASDLHLPDRSVSLSWRPDQPGSAWEAIPNGQGQENTGEFIWAVPPTLPPKFHVRVEAADSAGNLGVAETTDAAPVIVDRNIPRVRIIGLDTKATSAH